MKTEMNLPLYNPNAACPKCGSKGLTHWFHRAGEWLDGNISSRRVEQDLIRSFCRNCGFVWNSAPLDSQQKEPIILWRFNDAPKELQDISNIGDEDWLAEIPPHLADESLSVFEKTTYGHPFKTGWKIKIGCH